MTVAKSLVFCKPPLKISFYLGLLFNLNRRIMKSLNIETRRLRIMKKGIFLKAVMVVSVLMVSTVSLLATEAKKESMTKTTSTVGEKLDDTVTTTQVKMALLLHRSTSTLPTDVTTTNGVVVIEGTVQNSTQKELITKVVQDVNGVKHVKNNMTIANDKATVVEKLGDSALTAKVKMALALHRSTGALRTSVTTTDSVVTLSGEARNQAEKELVSKVVEDVDGVKSVVNTMSVK